MEATPNPPRAIYFNEAATSWPKAPGVAEAMVQALATPAACPGRLAGAGRDVLRECRERLASLLRVTCSDRIVLTMNATHALNLAIAGLPLTPGDHVITTSAEHNSVLRPLYLLRASKGIRVTVVDVDQSGRVDRAAFQAALAQGAALVAMTHASNVTGAVNDVRSYLQPARQAGACTLLDASQSIGHLPVNPEELGADMVAFPGHKGLRGPSGTGALYVAPHIELSPLLVGGTGVQSELPVQPEEMPVRLEAGTPNVLSCAGLAAALSWFADHGLPLADRAGRLGDLLRTGLAGLPRARLIGANGRSPHLPVISFRLEGSPVEETGRRLLEEHGIYCRTGIHCAPLLHEALGTAPEGTVRLSLSGFNTEEEVACCLDAVRAIAT
jgi:cysteine desulfurase family protein